MLGYVTLGTHDHEKALAFCQKALEPGATDEEAPGQRIEGFYAGYSRDLDGNKLNAFIFA
jgi:predicted lactoylglutathione lyase